MRRFLAIASLTLTAAFAVTFSWSRAHSSEGMLSDRELAQVFGGGGESPFGCQSQPDYTGCQGTSYACPDLGCAEARGAAPGGCNGSGTGYSGLTIKQAGSAINSQKLTDSGGSICTRTAGCNYPGAPVLNTRCSVTGSGGLCNFMGQASWQCNICTASYGTWKNQENYTCQDP
jgi:hypothetical protein